MIKLKHWLNNTRAYRVPNGRDVLKTLNDEQLFNINHYLQTEERKEWLREFALEEIRLRVISR